MAERRLGIAIDLSPTSKYALAWALEHYVRDGDHVFVIVVKKIEGGDQHLFEKTGSPAIPMHEIDDQKSLEKYGVKPDPEVFATIRQFVEKKKIRVEGKVYYGDARDKLLEAAVELDMKLLVLGSRGLGTVQRALLGSVSNYVVNNSACPVTVVKMPETKS